MGEEVWEGSGVILMNWEDVCGAHGRAIKTNKVSALWMLLGKRGLVIRLIM